MSRAKTVGRRGRGVSLPALAIVLALISVGPSPAGEAAPARATLRVCSDRDNLPFSDDRLSGFENRIAAIVASDLGRDVVYAWSAQHRGFLRKTLHGGACDVTIGVSPGLPRIATTRPYYRSFYVFVVRKSEAAPPTGFDDPRLAEARIGLHAIGLEGANTPPAEALARRGLADNVVGFPFWGAASGAQGDLIDAVAAGEIDVALAWGPVAGHFARRHGDALAIHPVTGDPARPDIPFAFDIAMGVREADRELLALLDGALARRKAEIEATLHAFGVPVAPGAGDGRDGVAQRRPDTETRP